MRTQARRADTRRKIQLGGLIIKAGLSHESPPLLLGLLLEAARALSGQTGPALRARFLKIGDLAFSENRQGGSGEK